MLVGGRAQEPLEASWKASLAFEFGAIAARLAPLSPLQQSDARSSSPGAAHTKLRARTSNCRAGKSSGSPLSGLPAAPPTLRGLGGPSVRPGRAHSTPGGSWAIGRKPPHQSQKAKLHLKTQFKNCCIYSFDSFQALDSAVEAAQKNDLRSTSAPSPASLRSRSFPAHTAKAAGSGCPIGCWN